jgi:hypothetical protein
MVQDEQQKVRTITALALAALAEAGRWMFFFKTWGNFSQKKWGSSTYITYQGISRDLPEPFKFKGLSEG